MMLDPLGIPYGPSETEHYVIRTANGSEMNYLGTVILNVFYQGRRTPFTLLFPTSFTKTSSYLG